MRVGDDVEQDHLRVMRWIMACLVLHNYLSLNGESDDWLEVEVEEIEEEDSDNILTGPQSEEVRFATDCAMKLAGESRRNSIRVKLQEEESFAD